MRRIPLAIFLWIVLSLSACTALPATTQPSSSPSKPQVGSVTAIPSETSTPERKSTEFVTATLTKTGPILLTQGVESGSASFVRWFPDGKRIVFSSNAGTITDHFRFYTVNSDGSGLQALKDIPANARTLNWSPDGTKILFCAFLPDSQKETMFLISSDGTNLTRISNKQIEKLQGALCDPVWSPDSKSIAFMAGQHENLYTVDVNGQNLRALSAPNLTTVGNLQWSPDGGLILFSAEDSAAEDKFGLYLVRANSSSPVLLRQEPNYQGGGQWSPDGQKILYLGDSSSYIINADGTNQTQITKLPTDASAGTWSPDGSQIAFASNPTGDYDIYVINTDGTNLRSYKNPGRDDTVPVWSPDGQQLVFSSHHQTEYGNLIMIGVQDLVSQDINSYMTQTQADPVITGAGKCKLPSANDTQTPSARIEYHWPTTSHVTDGQGYGSEQKGIFLLGKRGDVILAAADGIVIFAGESNSGLGNTVMLYHADGLSTVYTMLGEVLVQCGQTVSSGMPLARFGEFGNQKNSLFSFGIRQPDGEPVNPLDYLP